jgi:monovalent cation/proton antiporter MnhG/PhaG subunit
MTHHPLITGLLLGAAVALAIVCSIGLLVMRDAYQRLHFSAPVVTLSMLLICIAVFIEERDSQARIKVVLIYVLMLVMNSVLSHATGRAIRIRRTGHWDARQKAGVLLLNDASKADPQPPREKE